MCGTDKPEQEWVEETYEAERRRFCSAHVRAKFEAEPEPCIGETQALCQPLGYC